jgi:hypothetical protein
MGNTISYTPNLNEAVVEIFSEKSIVPSEINGPSFNDKTHEFYMHYEFTPGSYIFCNDENTTETTNPTPKDPKKFLTDVVVAHTYNIDPAVSTIYFYTRKFEVGRPSTPETKIGMIFKSMEELKIMISNNILCAFNCIDTIKEWTEDILGNLGIGLACAGKQGRSDYEHKPDDGSTVKGVMDYVQYTLEKGVEYGFYDADTKKGITIEYFNIIATPNRPDDAVFQLHGNFEAGHDVFFRTKEELQRAIASYIQRYSGATPTQQQWHALGKLTDLLVHLSAHARTSGSDYKKRLIFSGTCKHDCFS